METINIEKLKDYFEKKCPVEDLLETMHDIMIDYMLCTNESGNSADYAIERVSILNSFYETLRDAAKEKSLKGEK